jgi:hypothetical protein
MEKRLATLARIWPPHRPPVGELPDLAALSDDELEELDRLSWVCRRYHNDPIDLSRLTASRRRRVDELAQKAALAAASEEKE